MSLSNSNLSWTMHYCLNTSQHKLIDSTELSWVEQGLTSHQTHYRSYRGRVLWIKRPNQQCQSTEGREVLRTRLQSHYRSPHCADNNTTYRQYEKKKYTQITHPRQSLGSTDKTKSNTKKQPSIRNIKRCHCISDRYETHRQTDRHSSQYYTPLLGVN